VAKTIDFLLLAERDAEAAKPFFSKALAQPHTVNPRAILSKSRQENEDRWRAMASIATTTGEILEQYRGAGPSAREAADLSQASGLADSGRRDEQRQATPRWQ
jgi:hypothetical protein